MEPALNGEGQKHLGPLRVLVVGARRLYLQALCELLSSGDSMEATLASPKHVLHATWQITPSVVLVDSELHTDDLTELVASLRERHVDCSILLLTSSGARASDQLVLRCAAGGWVSLRQPVVHLATAIHPLARPRRGRGVRSASVPERFARLTDRELAVLELMVGGSVATEIADTLMISPNTVRTHVQNIKAKLDVRTRTELVNLAIEEGLRPRRNGRQD